MIISGESSGELYGALLARSLRIQYPDIKIVGVGGSRMQEADVELISTISGAFGLSEALKAFSKVKEAFNKVISSLQSFKPQVLILIDFPDFNIRIAKKAKKLDIKILYYVSPQIWAWRGSRIKMIGRLVDKMALILPFEEDIYNKAGIPCEFVGHPALDEIRDVVNEAGYTIDDIGNPELKKKIQLELGIELSKTAITLMPGSRPHEITSLLPVLVDVINELTKDKKGYQFIIPIAPNLNSGYLALFDSLKKRFDDCIIINKHSIKSLLASDLAIIASGTATLQAALIGVPMVPIYKLSYFSYLMGKLLVDLNHFSLVNILIDKSIKDDSILRIKELLQGAVTKDNIMQEILRITNDNKYKEDIRTLLFKIRELFIKKNASMRVAELVGYLYKL